MAWYCSGTSNSELVENLFREGLIKSPRVKEAMKMVRPPQPGGHIHTYASPSL